MTMLIAAGVLLGDGISFLNQFLRGGLTPRFLAKSLAIGGLAGAVFWYHLGSVGQSSTVRRDAAYALGLILAGILSAAAGFLNLGSPATSRLIEADLRRSQDLTGIALNVHNYWSSRKKLPSSLTDVQGSVRNSDPVTAKPYAYKVLSESNYELCAEFSAASADRGPFNAHKKGRHCFTLQADLPPF